MYVCHITDAFINGTTCLTVPDTQELYDDNHRIV